MIILIATVGFPAAFCLGFWLLISLIGLTELYKVVDVKKRPIRTYRIYGSGYIMEFYTTGQMAVCDTSYDAFLVVLMAVYVFSFPKFNAEQVMAAFFAYFMLR